uniref:Uncharacterized protein n=1 Tax=Cacopsylla melanoneura TaxID=428564 RepID=A0A8D8XSC9_9HEMI
MMMRTNKSETAVLVWCGLGNDSRCVIRPKNLHDEHSKFSLLSMYSPGWVLNPLWGMLQGTTQEFSCGSVFKHLFYFNRENQMNSEKNQKVLSNFKSRRKNSDIWFPVF